jgi:hypothetical protein
LSGFLCWTLGADGALPLEQPDFGTVPDMGILAMCHIADSDGRNTAEQIEAAKTGLLQICHDGLASHCQQVKDSCPQISQIRLI